MKVKYYQDFENEAVYAVSTMGFDGIFRLMNPPHGQWEYFASGTLDWDALHQKIYRAHRVVVFDPAQYSAPLPKLPEPPKGEKTTSSWADQLLPKRPVEASGYPLTRKRLESREDASMTVFAVLHEDVYETALGDGEFHFLEDVFLEKKEAERHMSQKQDKWNRFHLRTITVRLDGGSITFPSYEAYDYDHHKGLEVLNRLEDLFGPSGWVHDLKVGIRTLSRLFTNTLVQNKFYRN